MQRVSNKMNPKRPKPRHIIIKMPKVKDKERTLKAREKQLVTYKGAPIRLSVDLFLNGNFAGQKGLAHNIKSDEKQGPTTKITLPSKAIT